MRDHLPTYSQIAGTVFSVTNDIQRDRPPGRLWRNLTRGQIQRGDQYEHDTVMVQNAFKRAGDMKAKLDARKLNKIQRYRGSRRYRRLCKETLEVTKVASRRILNDSLQETSNGTARTSLVASASTHGVVQAGPGTSSANTEPNETRPPGRRGSFMSTHENQVGAPPKTPREPDGTDLPVGAPPATREELDETNPSVQAREPPTAPEESDETDPPAGASPSTPKEPDTSPPRSSFTDSHVAATSSIDESIEETTLPSGAAGIGAPVDRDDASSYSFFYDPSLAASGTSIASYKTERTVNSRKSHYSVLPRHKYADHGYLRPQCPESLGDTSVPKTELRDEDLDVDDEPPSSPHSAPPNSPELSPETLPLDGPANTEHVHEEAPSPPLSPNRAFAVFNCDSD